MNDTFPQGEIDNPLIESSLEQIENLPRLDLTEINRNIETYFEEELDKATTYRPIHAQNFIKETIEHSHQTAELLTSLYIYLGADNDQLAIIHTAALAHDLGKFRDNVINALSGELTDRKFLGGKQPGQLEIGSAERSHRTRPEVYDIFHQQTHPQLGARIARSFFKGFSDEKKANYEPLTNLMVQMAKYHHSSSLNPNAYIHLPTSVRDAGPKRGYPYPVKWEELPCIVQWMNMIDIYCALRQKRVYKDGMAHDKAMGILQSEFINQPEHFETFSEFCNRNLSILDSTFQ